MSRYSAAFNTSAIPTIIPPQHAESKRDRKRRETVNKVELLHDESWRNRDEKFAAQYKEYHTENKAVNSQPPSSSQYLLRLYPSTIERDALLESAEVEYQYKASQAKKMYDLERERIEAEYWDSRDQVRQRLLAAVDERRRKLREEKDGGDVVTGQSCPVYRGSPQAHTSVEALLEAQIKPRPSRKLPSRKKSLRTPSRSPSLAQQNHLLPDSTTPEGAKLNDLLLHSMVCPALAIIGTDDIIYPQSSTLLLVPPPNGSAFVNNAPGKRGPRGKVVDAAAESKEILAAPGTLTALAIASGQQQPADMNKRGGRGAGANANQPQWIVGKSVAELSKIVTASQLEMDSDWARIQGASGRGRRRGVATDAA